MELNRRTLLQTAAWGAGALVLSPPRAIAAPSRYAKPSTMKLGTVTYNLAKDWDLDTLLANCEKTKFEGVELRTTHAHGVEVSLSKDERAAVKKKFANSPIELIALGSAFDYHTPDQAKLRQDIEATKEYILLAQDVGAPAVKVRPNGFPENVPKDKTLEQIGKSLHELAVFGQDHGVQLRLEVHGRETCQLPHMRSIMDFADHANVGVVWNCNSEDLAGEGFDANFRLVEHKMFQVHLKDLSDDGYPYRLLFQSLQRIGFTGYCCAEIGESSDPIRLMQYYRALFLTYQDLL
ncbi:MAG: sugar phosphate isomerase/epimerase family protein [bacterium]|nr:sugar phosphate isomerase/epimerase family protein [bacterium]